MNTTYSPHTHTLHTHSTYVYTKRKKNKRQRRKRRRKRRQHLSMPVQDVYKIRPFDIPTWIKEALPLPGELLSVNGSGGGVSLSSVVYLLSNKKNL